MRLLFIILVVANVALFGYALLQPSARTGPDAPLAQEIEAKQIRVIPAPSPAALAQRAASCLQWGSFADAELDPVRRELVAALPPGRWSEARLPVIANWWVFVPPSTERAIAERKLRELAALGVTDYFLVEAEGPWNLAISLGVFRNEDAANGYMQSLRAKGVRNARVGNRAHRLTQTSMVVRDPDVEVSARLAELALKFPGSELRSGSCPTLASAR